MYCVITYYFPGSCYPSPEILVSWLQSQKILKSHPTDLYSFMEVGFCEILHNTIPLFCLMPGNVFGHIFFCLFRRKSLICLGSAITYIGLQIWFDKRFIEIHTFFFILEVEFVLVRRQAFLCRLVILFRKCLFAFPCSCWGSVWFGDIVTWSSLLPKPTVSYAKFGLANF